MTAITITVQGTPAPQGSKTGFRHPHTGRVIITDKNPRAVKTWRQDVVNATHNTLSTHPTPTPLSGPISVTITFHMPRPRAHYRTARGHQHDLKPGAPHHADKRPDIDKLTRSTLDALTTAGAYHDDSQVTTITVTKIYTPPGATPGAHITIRPHTTTPPSSNVYRDTYTTQEHLPL